MWTMYMAFVVVYFYLSAALQGGISCICSLVLYEMFSHEKSDNCISPAIWHS